MRQNEDWWFLDEGDDGVCTVVHAWNYVPLDFGSSDRGEEIYTLEEGQRLAPAEAEARIREILAEKGIRSDK